ncbi:hypothetical protein AJ79_06080 [Helicocarpus griseus UAMH5409]|uniref:Uncharacterized protein n=1 Tax=Helicocarpus griseus UAMH5409 TaxID=1447875 RepID=A0A2B7XGP0_9EURO|nr:hypothetical protein AJ79_06080 [Helicocarpus griseus UAMH5409]
MSTQERPAWKHSRELLRKLLIQDQLQSFEFSLKSTIDQNGENNEFAESFDLAHEGLAKRFRIAPWHFLYQPRRFRKACSNVQQYVERYIEELSLEEETESTPSDLNQQVARNYPTKKDVCDQLLNLLLAGRDATTSFSFATPMSPDRLRNEVIFSSSLIPIRPPKQPRSQKDSSIANRWRSRRSEPYSPPQSRPNRLLAIHYITEEEYLRADANEFRPECWEGDELANIGWAYIPFSGGPRRCLDEDFAIMEVSYTIVRLLQAIPSMILPEGEAVEPIGSERQRLTLVLSSEYGCRVCIKT